MGKIKNFDALSTTSSRRTVLNLVEVGLRAIDTETVVTEEIRLEKNVLFVQKQPFPLDGVGKVLVVGVGKCCAHAAHALERILGNSLSGGIVIDVAQSYASSKVTYSTGDHPFPSEKNIEATKKAIGALHGLSKNDLVIFIISGGGSVLLSQPKDFSVETEVLLTKELFGKGATIQELNTIRKHISLARGGFLAQYAYPAKVVSLIFSDVPGNDYGFIASGPTVKDETTVEDAKKILKKYAVSSITEEILIETPKEEKYFKDSHTFLLVSNTRALTAMATEAQKAGFSARIVTDSLSGEAKDVGEAIVEELQKEPPQSVLLYGGETTVTMGERHGTGGRNQEVVLSALQRISEDHTIAAVASDGRDNGVYAGALCDIITRKKTEEKGLHGERFLVEHDSSSFWKETEDYIETGPTSSNVSDLIIALKK